MGRYPNFDNRRNYRQKPREDSNQVNKPKACEFLCDFPSDPKPVVKRHQGGRSFLQEVIEKPKHNNIKPDKYFKKHPYVNKSFKSTKKNEDEDKPLEYSSKKRPPPLKIFHSKPAKTRDPRFEETSGEFNPIIFKAKYGKIIEEAKNKDKEDLLRERKRSKDPERNEQINYLLKRIEDQEKIEEANKKKEELVKKLKDEKRKRLNLSSKDPVFLNKSEVKQAILVEKFKELKKSSKLSKYIEKKRKRNVARERNKMFGESSFTEEC